MAEAGTDAEERQKARKAAKRRALELLRDGREPDDVVAVLVRDGMAAEVAQRAVDRADDALQAALGARSTSGCLQCDELLAQGAAYCDACGHRVPDDSDRELHRTQIAPRLAKGRKWLGAMAILYGLGGLLFGMLTKDSTVFVLNLVLAAIQAGLWRWSKRSLLPAAVTSLVMFCTIHLVDAVIEPATLVQGIVVKILFIAALIQAIRAALETRALLGRSAA